jgi:DNA repair photolyase
MGERFYQDALADRARGRGAGVNPGNRFESVRLHVLGEAMDEARFERPEGVLFATEVLDDRSRSILNPVDSPDLPMKWSINPYRGCEHGCAYCYARPTHENLGFSSGLDFERKIMAKREAPALLRRELSRPSWTPAPIMMSGVTDPYQPIERSLGITRGCLEVLAECRQPVGVITKNALVTRDIDLLAELASCRAASVAVSVTSLDPALSARMEPRAASPKRRLETIRRLSSAGIPVTVMVAPIVPALTDHEVPKILEAAADAGATRAGHVMLRLPHQVKAVFTEWVEREFPDRAKHVLSAVRETHGGKLYDSRWGLRGQGQGARAEQIGEAFRVFAKRWALESPRGGLSGAAFRRPTVLEQGQMGLF